MFPSSTDDVVVSPYNCAFALGKLIEHADCVFPFDNTSLIRITEKASPISNSKINQTSKAQVYCDQHERHELDYSADALRNYLWNAI